MSTNPELTFPVPSATWCAEKKLVPSVLRILDQSYFWIFDSEIFDTVRPFLIKDPANVGNFKIWSFSFRSDEGIEKFHCPKLEIFFSWSYALNEWSVNATNHTLKQLPQKWPLPSCQLFVRPVNKKKHNFFQLLLFIFFHRQWGKNN